MITAVIKIVTNAITMEEVDYLEEIMLTATHVLVAKINVPTSVKNAITTEEVDLEEIMLTVTHVLVAKINVPTSVTSATTMEEVDYLEEMVSTVTHVLVP